MTEQAIYVRAGHGTNIYDQRYQNRSRYIWNNTGDSAYLRSPSGRLLDSCSWGDGSGIQYC